MKKSVILTSSFLSLFLATSAFSDEEDQAPVLYTQSSLSIEMASKAAWGALLSCREQGYSIAVAVVDRGGNLQALLRDQFAGPHSPETARRKAWTSNSFRQDTGNLATLLAKGTLPSQVQHVPNALLLGGGLTIKAQGKVIGGIGVSGAPPGKTELESIDGACAKAGIDAIQEELDFLE